jgi:dipeptidyl aminopeptidase/acylaminoacyl peptidase
MNTLIRATLLAFAAFASCTANAQQAPDQVKLAPPPIADFFENPSYSDPELSPDAKYIAIRIGKHGMRDRLAVLELATNKATIVAGFSDVDIGRYQWVNSQRLVFTTTDREAAQGDRHDPPSLYAVNRDGGKQLQLAGRSPSPALLPWRTSLFSQAGRQDTENVYAQCPVYDNTGELERIDLLQLNTLTGRSKIYKAPPGVRDWLLDQTGEPRIAITLVADKKSILYNEPGTDEWRPLLSYAIYTHANEDAFAPLAFGPDGTFYVTTTLGKDKLSVHTFDVHTGQISKEPVFSLKDYDFQGALVFGKQKLLGIHYLNDAASTVWFDRDMKAVQQKVDALLPATINRIAVAARPETPFVVVASHSDIQPRFFSLFDTSSGSLNRVGETYPTIRPEQMGQKDLIHYTARDGLDIPAWLTLPHGLDQNTARNLPMVVLVHGGPWIRGGAWEWDPEVQFLASRGYAVLEPEFRGSTGYGTRHFQAGWKQWGLAMQNDVADGTRWAIGQGIAQPRRICIAGASYGGYATLMGLVNDPELYRCGIDWVGVTDIDALYSGSWIYYSDTPENWKKYGVRDLVGDQVKDAAQLRATSPLRQAARITQPLLLAYGGFDHRVPPDQGKNFRDAVRVNNPDVEWVLYPAEGHGWALPSTRVDFWSRVEKFLARNIGTP